MGLIYNIGIQLTEVILNGGALINEKLKKGVEGRKNTFNLLKQGINPSDKTLWFHCASLGEYEQGLPVFKALRAHYKNHKIILSFFSPSGYEIRKNSPIADVVVYLPLDTKDNAKQFLDIVNPELTIFVKYDIWPVFLNELKQRKHRAILISAAFRENQSFFKFYGKSLREALFAFEHIFTQNEVSKTLLNSINYNNVTVSGDTRYDRVTSQLDIDNTLEFIEDFKTDKLCIVAGSTWPEGESLLINFINKHAEKDIKFIIAPHNIKAGQIKNLQTQLKVSSVLFTEKEKYNLSEARVFIVNTIGILTKIYNYADIAYVGGALGHTGLHNTLEPAVFGIPIIIGNHYDKFPEAKALIDNGGMFSISNQKTFDYTLNLLISNEVNRLEAGHKNEVFIKKNTGAVVQILNYLRIL
ncbi:glycosyltransferase N-terminal domain-containing protein [Tamlana sp. 2_MG-2023]|uniref:3-deoxy-D-manno-octulosonic acid transferase n=1 Tax=unclassified Tamlana TaxID=2614803 RepID=UPI0026E35D31|nr:MULTISPECIES: glycosyltransferase N-terminal domain-containing protein [unclassified Tamlana]MDO6760648.1 glycosyltransferase N-terminal domain-containing protein [Tamlana sp. 2_MG-2023]MDO6790904.1 glycosyltransferase N-terminal domain-containing protein [Tamlana sp. 1_MG-2023]